MMMIWITVMLLNKIADSVQTDSVETNLIVTADVGDNVTLDCLRLQEENNVPIVWYKQKVGHVPHIMVAVQQQPSYEYGYEPPKFSIEEEERNLKIANVDPSDEAMYYCGYINFVTSFSNGIFLSVKGEPDLSVSVSQIGVSDSVPAGASVTLQCSVLSESRAAELQVLWFRAAPSQSHPQIIYTHHDSSRQCESGSSTHTCVYNISKNIHRLNDTGTYYCAVAVCGKIVFGNGTRVQMDRPVDPVVICLAGALGVCVLVVFAQAVNRTWRNCGQRRARHKQGSVTDKTFDQDGGNELNYAAFRFNERRDEREKGKKQQPQDIVYSGVRCPSIT